MISTTAQQSMSAGWTALLRAFMLSFVRIGVYGNHRPKWAPFRSGLMAVGVTLPGLGNREEKRITVPERQQIEVSF